MARIVRVWIVLAAIFGMAVPGLVGATDAGYFRPGHSDPRHPCRARQPYYDHGPNWGEDPKTTHPVYGIDPSCSR